MPHDVATLVQTGALDRLKIPDLKAFLKEHSLTTTGEKETLMWRIRTFFEGEKFQVEGVNPVKMKPAVLRQAVARRGLNPIGTQDELLQRLIPYLKENPTSVAAEHTGTSSSSSSSSSSTALDEIDCDGPTESSAAECSLSSKQTAIKVAKEVVRLAGAAEYVAILRLLGDDVCETSPVGLLRKAYLKLSLVIHPDKLSKDYPAATSAFQALVHAFDSLTRPELPEEPRHSAKEKGVKTVSRSNQGCFRTTVQCPRCKVEWGKSVEGNPPYFYNFMMTGVKSFVCSTCLLEFGCMSAIHVCPHCKNPFEYSPGDFHRKIKCGHKRCSSSEFGFWMYFVPENILDALRVEVKRNIERKLKEEEAKRRRATSSLRRWGDFSGEDANSQEKLFILGLRDECPRCGESLEGYPDEEEQRRHLRECTDRVKAVRYKQRLEERAEKAKAVEKTQDSQNDAAALAAFQLLGGRSSELWLLTEAQLQSQCSEVGLDCTGSKVELIQRLAQHRSGQKLLGWGETSTEASPLEEDTLPENLSGLTEAQLRAVCACQGIDPTAAKSKKDLLQRLELRRYGSEVMGGEYVPKVPLLEQNKNTSSSSRKRRRGGSDGEDEE